MGCWTGRTGWGRGTRESSVREPEQENASGAQGALAEFVRHPAGSSAQSCSQSFQGGREHGERTTRLSPSVESQETHAPPGILHDPPVVDVFEGITGHLLLVRAASAVLVSA